MESRRDFLKKAALLSGAAVWGSVPESIQAALAIDPETGSTYLDAEHIVILMQENRSFDHMYGTLQGVRGYSDPRAHILPNFNPVWLQTNADGETYAPFRLNIKDTKATWMGSLAHSWSDQVDARNNGAYDKWLIVKPSYYQGFTKKPMTLGHYTREDIPFYYALADAFTVCDQHFCSSLTGTTPNRLYLWSGTIRAEQHPESKPNVYNEEADFDHEVNWTTYPERLEDAGVSWKVYQNELTIYSGFEGEEESWLSNFGDNPLEYFSQYKVRLSARHRAFVDARIKTLSSELEQLQRRAQEPGADKTSEFTKKLDDVKKELAGWFFVQGQRQGQTLETLPERDRNLHEKAFSVNDADPDFRKLETVEYDDAGVKRKVQVPKGDVFHQFREDVNSGNLPTVSWIVGPENFSDHPASAWYGAWYVSEALDILTKNPEVWKKTIFILTYDENDGYFDHVPPFVAPNPNRPETGRVSEGVDSAVEYITKEQDKAFRPDYDPRDSSIGLGYRVPFVVASPWSRGGCVCSELFDHTSVLQFLEHFLQHKTGKPIKETNISEWRRAVCGDLTSVFRPYDGGKTTIPAFPPRNEFIEGIHKARFKTLPTGLHSLGASEIEDVKQNPGRSPLKSSQEPGTRKSCPLPYELYADGNLSSDKTSLEIRFRAGDSVFGKRSAGAPFNVYAYRKPSDMQARSYALRAGKDVQDSWLLSDFGEGGYHVRVDGPNGFLRELKGSSKDPSLEIHVAYAKHPSKNSAGGVEISLFNSDAQPHIVEIADLSYGGKSYKETVDPGRKSTVMIDMTASHGWYDLSVTVEGSGTFSRRVAGRVENGTWSITDPVIGRT
jgi:phospholipase C